MNILFLYNNGIVLDLADWIKSKGHSVVLCNKKIDSNYFADCSFDLAISYSYSYILPAEIINILNGNIINMHISYLPWNRGGNPNQWSLIDKTPPGVTIHYMNEKLDKGRIIAQSIVQFDENETLSSSYSKLHIEMKSLFQKIFPYYSFWREMSFLPSSKGTYHSTADFKKYKNLITSWDMPVKDFLCLVNGTKED
ncbi:MAG: formyltransferase family protein [Oscillospiraceae bacterium]